MNLKVLFTIITVIFECNFIKSFYKYVAKDILILYLICLYSKEQKSCQNISCLIIRFLIKNKVSENEHIVHFRTQNRTFSVFIYINAIAGIQLCLWLYSGYFLGVQKIAIFICPFRNADLFSIYIKPFLLRLRVLCSALSYIPGPP